MTWAAQAGVSPDCLSADGVEAASRLEALSGALLARGWTIRLTNVAGPAGQVTFLELCSAHSAPVRFLVTAVPDAGFEVHAQDDRETWPVGLAVDSDHVHHLAQRHAHRLRQLPWSPPLSGVGGALETEPWPVVRAARG